MPTSNIYENWIVVLLVFLFIFGCILFFIPLLLLLMTSFDSKLSPLAVVTHIGGTSGGCDKSLSSSIATPRRFYVWRILALSDFCLPSYYLLVLQLLVWTSFYFSSKDSHSDFILNVWESHMHMAFHFCHSLIHGLIL